MNDFLTVAPLVKFRWDEWKWVNKSLQAFVGLQIDVFPLLIFSTYTSNICSH